MKSVTTSSKPMAPASTSNVTANINKMDDNHRNAIQVDIDELDRPLKEEIIKKCITS